MNLSGAVLRPWLRRPFWAVANDLLVVSDEVQLDVGTYRFRARGSAGGHNGLKSIEQALGNQEYARLRVGVGPTDAQRRVGDLADYVLDDFGKAEGETVRALLPTLEEALRLWTTEGIERVMNAFTG
jgi:PTH1 family peptidyl-tRNA hydrolase